MLGLLHFRYSIIPDTNLECTFELYLKLRKREVTHRESAAYTVCGKNTRNTVSQKIREILWWGNPRDRYHSVHFRFRSRQTKKFRSIMLYNALESFSNGIPNSQCSGSVMFKYGSRSEDPYHWIADTDLALFFCCFQDANKKLVFCMLLSVQYVYINLQR